MEIKKKYIRVYNLDNEHNERWYKNLLNYKR